MQADRRSTLVALALLAAAVAVLCAPILLDRSLYAKDIFHFTYSQRHYLRERLLAGELPLWWPSDGLGRPFFALVQPGVLYVGNLLLLLPMPHAYDVFSAAHAFIAAFGAYAWLRRSDCDPSAATLGALVFVLSGYFVSLFGNNGVYVFGAAWVPAILAAAAGPASLPRVGGVALLLALCLSAGDPQAFYFAGIALATQALGRARSVPRLALVGGAASLAGLIAAVVLLPGASTAAMARPGGVPIEEAHHFAVHPLRLLELLWPAPFGAPYGPGWNIAPLVDEGTHGNYEPLTASLYCGIACAPLAWVALRGRRREDVAFAWLALGATVVALGQATPAWALVHRFLPLARSFRFPEKWMMLATLAIAYLAGRGLTEVARAPRLALRPAVALFGVCSVAAIAALSAGGAIERAMVGVSSTAPRDEALRSLVVAASLLAVIRAWTRGALSPSRARVIFVLVAGGELLVASAKLVPWTPSQTYRDRSPILDEPAIASRLRRGAPPPRLYRPTQEDFTAGARSPALDRATLLPNCGVEDGLAQLDAYYVFHTESEEVFWKTLRTRPLRLLQWTATPLALLADTQLRGAPPSLRVVKAYPQLGISLVEVAGTAPHVYLATAAHVAADAGDAARMLLSSELVPGADAVVERGEAGGARGRCDLERYLPEHVAITCESSAPSYAVVADTWFVGWRASVNGSEAPILRANGTMRAVRVPAGRSRVELTYVPPHLRVGAWLSAVGLALALLLVVGARRRAPVDATTP